MARHRHPAGTGSQPGGPGPGRRGRQHRGAPDRRTAQDRAGPGQFPGPGGGVRAGSCPGREASGAGQHDRTASGVPGLGCAAVPVMARGQGRRPQAGGRMRARGRRGGGAAVAWRPARPGSTCPGEGCPGSLGSSRARGARQPADAPRARQAIRATGTGEPAVTAGTVPTARPSSCRAGASARGRCTCGRTPVTREENHG